MSKSSKDIAEALTNEVFKTLKKDLSKGKVMLPDEGQSHGLPLLATSKVSKAEEKNELQLHSIVRKRKMLEQELERIRYDEEVVKQKRPHPMQETEEGKTRYFRSTITPQEKQKIKKVLQETKKFQKQAELKTLQLQQKIAKQKQQKRRQKEQQQKQLHERKKRQVNEKLKQIENRKISRTKQILSANREYQKVARLKFLHEAIEEKWRIIQKSEEEENQKMLEKKREEKKFKISQIKEHARRYSDIAIMNQEKRERESEELRASLIQQSRLARHSHSTFFKTINEEQAERKESQAEQVHHNKMLQTKKAMYAETVKEKNKSLFKGQSPPLESKTADIRTSRSLDNLALNKLGNQYMKQIHSCIDTTPVLQNCMKAKNQETFKYTDYLTKARLTRKTKNPQEEAMELKELKSIIKKKNEDKEIRLEKAKQIVQKLDQKSDKSSKNLVNTILAKLSLIEQFSH